MPRRRSHSLSRLLPAIALAASIGLGAAGGCGGDTTQPATTGNGGGGETASSSSRSSSQSSSQSSSSVVSSSATGGSGGAGGGSGGAGGAGGSAGGVCDPTELPVDPNGLPPALLSASGLYADLATDTQSAFARPYTPQFTLWSDGAEKRRWIYIPSGCVIDNTNPDSWIFPVGTRLWKEFADPNDPSKKLETRMIEHFGPGDTDWTFVAYAWRQDQSEADLTDGAEHDDWLGTAHDIPSSVQCKTCHHPSLPDHAVLGFDAIQLNGAAPVTQVALSQEGLLLNPVAADYVIPGDAAAVAALGYLHANCGQCHNPNNMPAANSFWMRVRTTDTDVTQTNTYVTGVNVATTGYHGHVGQGGGGGAGGSGDHPISTRILPGDPGDSCVWFRMSSRSGVPDQTISDQMPPLATEDPDPTGLATIAAWIDELP
jgi:hypothetical protein